MCASTREKMLVLSKILVGRELHCFIEGRITMVIVMIVVGDEESVNGTGFFGICSGFLAIFT